MKIVEMEKRNNDFIQSLRKTLKDSFSPIGIDFNVSYCTATTQDGNTGLWMTIRNNVIGVLYTRFELMSEDERMDDLEKRFIKIVNDELILAGVTFLNTEIVRERNDVFKKRAMPSDNRIIWN